MMRDENSFQSVESYKHKFAKETLANWLREVARGNHDEYVELAPFKWRVNRSTATCGVWTEYPICINEKNELVGYSPCWDEMDWNGTSIDKETGEFLDCGLEHQRPPTYAECIKAGLLPIAIFDVVIQHKGNPSYAIEVVYKNDISPLKMNYLERLSWAGVTVYKIDADWILYQVGRPKQLQCQWVA